jgi:hypothetical protein
MKIKNQILNYFAFFDELKKEAKVFLAPVTMNASVAKMLLNNQLKTIKKSLPIGVKLLHVCFDLDSKRLYLPNAKDFLPLQIEPLLSCVKEKIKKEYGNISNNLPIEGSPFSSIRIRNISSFCSVNIAISKQFPDIISENLMVIEANLARMPKTVKKLPYFYHKNKNFVGGYIGKEFCEEISFYDEIDLQGKIRSEPINLITVKAPFILIDISPNINPSIQEKEWVVLSGLRDHFATIEPNEIKNEIALFADLYGIRQHLYLGWTFEEICSLFLEQVKNFGELIKASHLLANVAKSLNTEKLFPYYLSFKIDLKDFPLRLESIMDELNNFSNEQIGVFQVIEYNPDNGYILIESFTYISADKCINILKAKSRPLICHYNKIMGTIDIKTSSGLLKELSLYTKIPDKIKEIIRKTVGKKDIDFRVDNRAKSISLSGSNLIHLRRISEYPYACDYIKKMCSERKMNFVDVDVIVGPLARIFGQGVVGGFMGKKQFNDSKLKIPHQIVNGIWVSPPLIAVDSVSSPSYSKQTETLIHEYSHNLFNMQNENHECLYHKDKNLKRTNELKWWDLYLNDPDEKLAHEEEIKYQLLSGYSVDEIIRDKIGGAITLENMKKTYPIALKFKKLVEESVAKIESEQKDYSEINNILKREEVL